MNNTQKYLTPPEVLAVPATAAVARLGSVPAWVLFLGHMSDCSGASSMNAVRTYDALLRMGISESVRHIATHVTNVGGFIHSVTVIEDNGVAIMSVFRTDDSSVDDRCTQARVYTDGTVSFLDETDTLTETIIDIRHWISAV